MSDTDEQLARQAELQAAIENCAAAYGFTQDGAVADYLVVFAYQRVDGDGDLTERFDQISSPNATLRSIAGLVMHADESVRSDIRGQWSD